MKKLFPAMIDAPRVRTVGFGISYWFFAFFLLPGWLSLSTITTRGESYEVWMDIGYHVCNFILVLILFVPYLKDAFLTVQLKPKEVFVTGAICAGLIILTKVSAILLANVSRNYLFAGSALGVLLTNETVLHFFPTALMDAQPLWGTLPLVLLAPFTTSCLLYGCGFAPIATRRPWVAYLVMAGVLLLFRLVSTLFLWSSDEEMSIFLLQLPIHMLACWSYQKTDTVWTPILALFFSNAILALAFFCLRGIL